MTAGAVVNRPKSFARLRDVVPPPDARDVVVLTSRRGLTVHLYRGERMFAYRQYTWAQMSEALGLVERWFVIGPAVLLEVA